MRTVFRDSLSSDKAIPGVGDPRTFVAMSYWYGGLYVVVEAWLKELGDVNDPRIDGLLANTAYVDLLRRYRNATFHYQPGYFHDKFLELMREGEEANNWIHDLHKAFQSYLENWFKASGNLEKARENAEEVAAIRERIAKTAEPVSGETS